jgi:hypothetical protein
MSFHQRSLRRLITEGEDPIILAIDHLLQSQEERDRIEWLRDNPEPEHKEEGSLPSCGFGDA